MNKSDAAKTVEFLLKSADEIDMQIAAEQVGPETEIRSLMNVVGTTTGRTSSIPKGDKK
jgi:hypothetical protein